MAYSGPTIVSQSYVEDINDVFNDTVTVTSGNSVIVLIGRSVSTTTTIDSVTDSQGNTWTKHVDLTFNNRYVACYTTTVASSGSLTITTTCNNIMYLHVRTVVLDSPVSVSITDSFNDTTNQNIHYAAQSSGINTQENSLLFAIYTANSNTTMWTGTTGWTSDYNNPTYPYAIYIQHLLSESALSGERAMIQSVTARIVLGCIISVTKTISYGNPTLQTTKFTCGKFNNCSYENYRINQT